MIAVIADDLTGASDAGVHFARRGLVTRVLFDVREPAATDEVEVAVVDTDSRALSADAAYSRVRGIAEALRRFHPEHVYKKVDSTLRGNLGAEIDAVMDALGYRLAMIAPAFPALGRTTRDGLHRLDGRPVHETEVGRDPKTPVRDSNVARLLQTQSRRAAAVVSNKVVASGAGAIWNEVEAHVQRGASLLVCDADSDAALRAIAASGADRRDILWVGSGGLADHLAEALGLPVLETRAATVAGSAGPVLVVAGSASRITRRQVEALCALPHVATVKLDPGAAGANISELERCRHELEAALASGQDCALVVARGQPRVDRASCIVDMLGSLAAHCASVGAPGGLILTGGDTARAVCRHLGASSFELVAEIEPGVPLGRLVGHTSTTYPAVTKAGAFGTDQTLVRALHHLKGDR